MNIRIAAILLLCSITALFPAALSAASAADEAAALFAGLRAAGAQLDGWTLDEVKSDAGSIHTRWTAPQSAAVLNIVLHARNEAAPSFAMTRLYNVFVETGSGGATLSDTESSFVNAFVSYIRLHETSAGALLPYDEFRQAEERRRVEENLQKKAVEARHRELESSSFARLLPAGVQMRDFGDTMALYLLPAFLLMLMFSLYVSKNAQLQMEPELRVYLRDIFNRAFKFIVIFQAGLAARHFSPDALINLVNSPLVPAGRPFDTLSNSFVYLILGGGEVRYIGAFLLLLALFFVFLHAAMLLSFLVFHERMHALAALVFVCSYPWFLLPVETLLPVLLFGWLFIHSLICAVLLARFSHHAWRLGGIMALATALACLIHPAALTAALYIPLAAVFNISNSRVAVGRFSNWIAWFAGVLSSAILLFKLQYGNPEIGYGGVFASGIGEFINNLLHLRWFDLSIGSLPHLIFLMGGLAFLLGGREKSPELRLLAFIWFGGVLFCAFMPLSAQHPLLYSGLPGLAGLIAAPALRALWVYFEYKPFPLRLALILTAAVLSAASPFLATAMN